MDHRRPEGYADVRIWINRNFLQSKLQLTIDAPQTVHESVRLEDNSGEVDQSCESALGPRINAGHIRKE